ncbi:DUF563 domain-containing protein [bacterium]|nr:DUF563 domain-containing protein [bacterium]
MSTRDDPVSHRLALRPAVSLNRKPEQTLAVAGMPRMRIFYDVPVMPTHRLFERAQLSDGGPIWPDFKLRLPIRHKRRGKVADSKPKLLTVPTITLTAPCVWGGYVTNHFGHLIAEHMTRVLQSVTERPDDTFLFVGRPGCGADAAPGFFWTVMEWYGLRRENITFVTEPLKVKTLRVVPEAEQWDFGEPLDAYLDLLDRLPQRNRLVPIQSDVLYVSRVGLLQDLKGGHAGESYLVSRLEALGIRVLDPAKAPLIEQLALYAGAKTILFAEGSAIHGRQLLGRIPQKIVVLVRRPGWTSGLGILKKRCDMLTYAEVSGQFVSISAENGQNFPALGISFYDVEALHNSFAEIGINLAQGWSQAAYISARDKDARDWLAAVKASSIRVTTQSYADIETVFEYEGVPR